MRAAFVLVRISRSVGEDAVVILMGVFRELRRKWKTTFEVRMREMLWVRMAMERTAEVVLGAVGMEV